MKSMLLVHVNDGQFRNSSALLGNDCHDEGVTGYVWKVGLRVRDDTMRAAAEDA